MQSINSDQKSVDVDKFFKSFDAHYDILASDIYILNSSQSFERLEAHL